MSTRRSSQQVRDEIVRAAVAEFEANGYAGATMRDVATRAQVSLSVTHRHFGTKARLFAAALLVPFREFLAEFAASWSRSGRDRRDDEDVLREFITELFERLSDHRAALVGLVGVGEGREEVQDEFRAAMAGVFVDLDEIGREAAATRGWLTEQSAVRGERLVMMLVIGAVLSHEWFPGREEGDDGGKALIGEITRFVLAGLGRPPE